MSITKDDLNDLKYAKTLLENPSLAARISNLLGTPLEKGFEYLPSKWKGIVQKATEKSLEKALNFAIQTMNDRTRPASFDKTHKMVVLATGARGWLFRSSSLNNRTSCDHNHNAALHSRHRTK